MNIKVDLQVETQARYIPDLQQITTWINTAARLLKTSNTGTKDEITVRVVGRAESAHLNETYRHTRGPTNVLSFPDTPFEGLDSISFGDLAICAELLEEEAHKQDKTLEAHWAHLVVHGFLHLLGYDHLEEKPAAEMEALEVNILKHLDFPDPYI